MSVSGTGRRDTQFRGFARGIAAAIPGITMRHLLLISTALLALSGPARADGPMDFQQARELKRTGKALTGVGVVLHAISLPLIALAAMPLISDHPPAPGDNNHPMVISGAVLTAASAITLGTGLGLWGAGARAERNERAWAFRF